MSWGGTPVRASALLPQSNALQTPLRLAYTREPRIRNLSTPDRRTLIMFEFLQTGSRGPGTRQFLVLKASLTSSITLRDPWYYSFVQGPGSEATDPRGLSSPALAPTQASCVLL